MTILLEAQNLSRYFGPNVAVQNIDITVKRGEILGFLGPNGAGKSTTMKMLSGNLAPDKGEIHINGFDLLSQPKQAKAQLGYLPENPPLYRELTVTEYLQHCARLNQLRGKQLKSAVATVIERCGLGDVQRRLIGQLSKGYQQRTGIAQAIVHNPAVVIFDEPTSGLDPLQIRQIRELIRELANEHSVILSTHILPEVEMLCDRVQIISKGQVMFADSLKALHQQRLNSSLKITLAAPPELNELQTLMNVSTVEAVSANQFRIIYHPEQDPTENLIASAVSKHWQLQELVREQDSLEDIFMHLIKDDAPLAEVKKLMWCVARLEISRLFLSPFAWIMLALVQFLLAYMFLSHIEYFAQIQGQISAIPGAPGVTEMIIAPLLSNAALVLLLIAPFITMRAFADEHRNHSLPLLISAPLSASQIVLGKYIGYLGFFLLQLVLIALMPLSLLAGSAIDLYQFGVSMFGLFLLVASFLAAGIFLSSLTTQPIIAAVMTFCLLFLLWIIDFAAASAVSGQINWLAWLSLLGHFQPMLSGQINSVDLSFFALFCMVFILMTIRRLDAARLSL